MAAQRSTIRNTSWRETTWSTALFTAFAAISSFIGNELRGSGLRRGGSLGGEVERDARDGVRMSRVVGWVRVLVRT